MQTTPVRSCKEFVGFCDFSPFFPPVCLFAGRAIRHRGDYATILLLDQRYGSVRIKRNLPEWISNRLQHHARFGSAFAAIRKVSSKLVPRASLSMTMETLGTRMGKQQLLGIG